MAPNHFRQFSQASVTQLDDILDGLVSAAPLSTLKESASSTDVSIASNGYWDWPADDKVLTEAQQDVEFLFSADHVVEKLRRDAAERAARIDVTSSVSCQDDSDIYWSWKPEAAATPLSPPCEPNVEVSEASSDDYWAWKDQGDQARESVRVSLSLESLLASRLSQKAPMECVPVAPPAVAANEDYWVF